MKSYNNIQQRLKGPVFSILTPFNEDESIDYTSLKNYINKVYRSGGRQFYVMGYNSRYSQLSWDEIKELNSFVTNEVKTIDKSNIMIVADPLHCSTKVSVEFAQHAMEVGADMISLIVRERFYSEEQIYRHFELVHDQSDIGILIHEMPFLDGLGGPPVGWPISLIDRLADLPRIVAIKEDAKDDEFSREVINKVKDRVSIIISGGGKSQWLRFAEDGCQCWLNGIGVFEPRLASLFWEHYQTGRKDKYMEIVDSIEAPFFEHGVRKFGWHLTIKAALEARGLMSRKDRMPLMELNVEDAKSIADLINSLPIDRMIGL